MSIVTEKNVYESGNEDRGSGDKLSLEVYEASGQFIYMPKIEFNADRTMLDTHEDRSDEKNGIFEDDTIGCSYHGRSWDYYDERMDTCREIEIGYEPLSTTMPVDAKIEDQWEEADQCDDSATEAANFEENQIVEFRNNNNNNDDDDDDNDNDGVDDDDDDNGNENADDSDEETIATFLTAAGQRLALYAVEDSDQVFAVAVYDESGAPPTNFQFLVKSDVERLIGEGAVRTVKKPTQMKRQLFTNEPFSFPRSTEMDLREARFDDNDENDADDDDDDFDDYDDDLNTIKRTTDLHNANVIGRTKEKFDPLQDDRKNVNYVNVEKNLDSILPSSSDQNVTLVTDRTDAYEEENTINELVQQSTVDNLFMDNDKSDDELTYADIEETLKNFQTIERKFLSSNVETTLSNWPDESIESDPLTTHENDTTRTVMNESPGDTPDITEHKEKLTVITINTSTSGIPKRMSLVRKNYTASSSLIRRRDDNVKQNQQQRGARGTSLLIGNNNEAIVKTTGLVAVASDLPSEMATTSPKPKRPRKQQLTLVNRGDSEIIIQPATFQSPEDEEDEDDEDEDEEQERRRKRKSRRKRKPVTRSLRYKMKASVTKRLDKKRDRRRGRRGRGDGSFEEKTKQYEIIEIDVDEKDRTKEKNIVEITIDENKGSSDKENEVIMVGDSDDDDDDDDYDNDDDDDDEDKPGTSKNSGSSTVTTVTNPLLECQHCLRTFRQKRALKTHSRLCPKSPKNLRRLEERATRSNNDSSLPKKQFICKICEEKFDVVVVLARHVKSMHSLRKRANISDETIKTRKERGSDGCDQEAEADKTNESIGESAASTPATMVTATTTTATATATATATTARRRRKRRRRRTKTNNIGWKGEKLHCSDCAKWFSSAALLASHSLQHATKKSEKQIRRCQTCKKILKSRLLYIRHMRMHSRAKKLQKKLRHTRQTTVKLATLKKRGRPRKL